MLDRSSPSPQPCSVSRRVSLAYLAALLVLIGSAAGFYWLGIHQGSREETRASRTVKPEPRVSQVEPVAIAPPGTSPSPLALIHPGSVADVAQAVSPSVVNIDVFNRLPEAGSLFPESEFFFNGNRVDEFPGVPVRPRLQKYGTGSGLIIRPDGYILTNNHVVRGTDRIKVTLSDHRSFTGEIVGRDSLSDLAVVKIPVSGLPAAKLGSSGNLRPGDWAIAIGSPLGLDHTVTLGIISAIGRPVSDFNAEVGFIQTDAAINPGNSGGPLLNLEGEVIGINTFIRSDAQNIGFATPIDSAKTIFQELLSHGKVNRSWVGIKLALLTDNLRDQLGLSAALPGVVIVSVIDKSPAAAAGIKSGDLLVKVDNRAVASVQDVQRLIQAHKPGEKVVLGLLRQRRLQTAVLVLGEMPEDVD